MDVNKEHDADEIKRSMDVLMAAVDKADPAPSARAMGAAMIRMGAFMMASVDIDRDEFLKLCGRQYVDAAKHQDEERADGTPLH